MVSEAVTRICETIFLKCLFNLLSPIVSFSGDLMEGELYSALKEEEASESVSSTNFSGEMHFYELVEDTKDGIWLVQV